MSSVIRPTRRSRGTPSGRALRPRIPDELARKDSAGPITRREISDEIDCATWEALHQMPAATDAGSEEVERACTEISNVLRRRNVSPKDIGWPRPDILIPSLAAIRYSEIPSAFANLVASAMERVRAAQLLPAYVEILKQLSADEVAMLQATPAPGRVFPSADLVFVLPSREVVVGYRHLVPPKLADSCRTKANIPQYVDNLLRLNLVYSPNAQTADEPSYRALTRPGFLQDIRGRAPPGARVELERRTLGITNLGEHFRRACLLD